jgi:hypothetical protein
MHSRLFAFGLVLAGASAARAAYVPIALTPGSYNKDAVVEQSAPAPVGSTVLTTASVDYGTGNSGNSWYEQGFNTNAASTGIPPANSVFTSQAAADHQYRMAPSYTAASNAIVIDDSATTAAWTLTHPTNATALSFLGSSGNAQSGPRTIQYVLGYNDGTTETGSFDCPDWYSTTNVNAWVANGRVNVQTLVFDAVNLGNPKLFSFDVTVTNTSGVITNITLNNAGGVGHAVVLAVSAQHGAGAAYVPLVVTGYTEDVVVEASGSGGALLGYTTVGMDGGTANSGFTWYEQGYDPNAPSTGLPPAGSTFVSLSAADHSYTMAPSYATNNVVFVQSNTVGTASITLASPAPYSALSFLTAGSAGGVTNRVFVNFADGTQQALNNFPCLDWSNNVTAAAWVADGRVSLNTRALDNVSAGYFRLYSVDYALTKTNVAITNIVVNWFRGRPASHAVIFAVSGIPVGGSAPAPVVTIRPNGNGTLTVSSTEAGELFSTLALDGASTVWHDDGAINTSVTITPALGEPVKFYRVRSP